MNVIIIEPQELQNNRTVYLDERRSRHVLRVLKKTVGDQLRIGIINGPCGQGYIRALEPTVTIECSFDEAACPEIPAVDLLLALPRPKVLKRLLAQLAAVGVGHVYLTNAEKVERCYFDTHVLNPAFIHEKSVEGLQQCGQTYLPEVTIHRRFKVLLEDELGVSSDNTARLYAHPGDASRMADRINAATGKILLAIGPEGGWTPYECTLLEKHGFRAVSVGLRILRTDTACISLLALAHDALSM